MSNQSYTLLNNSTEKHDVAIPVKELALLESSSTTKTSSGEALQKRYMQIAVAVALYW